MAYPQKTNAPIPTPMPTVGPLSLDYAAKLGGLPFAAQPGPTQQAITNTSNGMAISAPQMPAISPVRQSMGLPQRQVPEGMEGLYRTPETAALLKQLDEAHQGAIGGQEQGVTAAEQQLKDYLAKNEDKLDLTPLLQLADTWTGSSLSRGYQKPETEIQRMGVINELQNGLNKARTGLTQQQTDYLKDRFGIINNAEQTAAMRDTAKAKLAEGEAAKESKDAIRADEKLMQYGREYHKDYGDPIKNLGSFASTVTDLKNMMAKNGGQVPGPSSPLFAEYRAAVGKLTTRYNSDIAKLGALAGGDLGILRDTLGQGTDAVENWKRQNFFSSPESASRILDSLLEDSDRTVNNAEKEVALRFKNKVDDQYQNSRENYLNAKEKGNFKAYSGAAAGNPSKPSTVVQDGHTYTLNPKTGEYE